MTTNEWLQLIFFFFVLLLSIKPLGRYITAIYQRPLNKTYFFERIIYRFCGITFDQEMNWKQYTFALCLFNFFGLIILYAIQRLQFFLPLNPEHFTAVSPDLALNTAASFVTNTNWQAYAGENTLSYLSQMTGLTVQNFLSASTGIAVLIALIRGLTRHETTLLGNFWVDIFRSTLYLLLPLSIIFSIFLTSQGVIQNFKPTQTATLLDPIKTQHTIITTQNIPMGPVASQVAIKQLGTNGGGFFNANAAHPFENPNPLTNFFELLAILMIPAALCYTFGQLIKDTKQGRAILITMFLLFIPCVIAATLTEQIGNPALKAMHINQTTQPNLFSGGNLEGKEIRNGIVNSTLWATATTATSNGSVNTMHDSLMPLTGLITLWLMHLSEIVFGGVGSGLYGMILFILLTVFISGLMIGRTPEYLGKKIEPFEMKMTAFAILLMPMMVLILTAIVTVTPLAVKSIGNPGAQGFSEILYAFTSMGNNNGSAFAGLNANLPFYNIVGGIEMLALRFWTIIAVMAVAGSLAEKKKIPTSAGTLDTYTPLFIILLTSVILIIGALTFFPALSLGPIIEHILLWRPAVSAIAGL